MRLPFEPGERERIVEIFAKVYPRTAVEALTDQQLLEQWKADCGYGGVEHLKIEEQAADVSIRVEGEKVTEDFCGNVARMLNFGLPTP